ncbi:hypothetical protein DBR42_16205, partial [Pelomonas sp. HMWF004]
AAADVGLWAPLTVQASVSRAALMRRASKGKDATHGLHSFLWLSMIAISISLLRSLPIGHSPPWPSRVQTCMWVFDQTGRCRQPLCKP